MNTPIFHLAIPVKDIPQTKAFYVEGLGCDLGRETDRALILNFYGHQLVAHVTNEESTPQKGIYPRHFGMIFPTEKNGKRCGVEQPANNFHFISQPNIAFLGNLLNTAPSS